MMHMNMQPLIVSARKALASQACLPFSIYSSMQEQRIFNVPIMNPLLVCVLSGCKKLGDASEISGESGQFIFLSNTPTIDMRNIPSTEEYIALLIEFDYDDFRCLQTTSVKTTRYFQGQINSLLAQTLQQFIEWSVIAPPDLWSVRKQEILQLLLHLGHEAVTTIAEAPSLSHKIHQIISTQLAKEAAIDVNAETLASTLAMSESTLRRKLNSEGTGLTAIKERAKLSLGLHLVQTTLNPIGQIAEQCGYLSPSRFTDKFKQRFGITPRDLRKTRMND